MMGPTNNGIINAWAASPPSTPRRKGRSSDSSQGSQAASVPREPRKRPTCRYCGRLKEGHPKSGCPYVDPAIPPSPPQNPAKSTGNNRRHSDPRFLQIVNNNTINQLSEAAGRLTIAAHPTRPEWGPGEDGGSGPDDDAPAIYPNAPVRRTRTQEEQELLLRKIVRDHPSTVYVVPLSAEDLQAQRKAAQKTGHHTRILQPQPSWQDPRGVLIFGKSPTVVDEHCKRVERCAARGVSLKEILSGVGMARGLVKDMLAVWSLFSG